MDTLLLLSLSLALRYAHYFALGLTVCLAVTALRPQQRVASLRGALLALLASAATAGLWPLFYAAALQPLPTSPGLYAALIAYTGKAWLPSFTSLLTLRPDWPLLWRADPGIAASYFALRQLGWAYGIALLSLLLIAWSLWRQKIVWAYALSLLGGIAFLSAQPQATLLLVKSSPSSFEQAAGTLEPKRVLAGRQLYQQHCLHCHGQKANGDGPIAAQLKPWPTVLGPSLFRNQYAGELYWHVKARHSSPKNMDQHALRQLDSEDIWRILDFLRVNAAGLEATRLHGWQQALHVPQVGIRCQHHSYQSLHALQGRLYRIVTYDSAEQAPMPEPLLFTVALGPEQDSPQHWPSGVDCVSSSPEALATYALIAGRDRDSIAGTQFLVDQEGWLRSLSLPGSENAWTIPDNMCGVPDTPPPTRLGLGLEEVLQRIRTTEVEPPRYRPRQRFF